VLVSRVVGARGTWSGHAACGCDLQDMTPRGAEHCRVTPRSNGGSVQAEGRACLLDDVQRQSERPRRDQERSRRRARERPGQRRSTRRLPRHRRLRRHARACTVLSPACSVGRALSCVLERCHWQHARRASCQAGPAARWRTASGAPWLRSQRPAQHSSPCPVPTSAPRACRPCSLPARAPRAPAYHELAVRAAADELQTGLL